MAREETRRLSFSSDSHYPAGGRPGSNMDTLTEEETEDGGGYSDSNSSRPGSRLERGGGGRQFIIKK